MPEALTIYASSGGGVRIGASFGAQLQGEDQKKLHPSMFRYFVGTSAGAFDAALSANGWKAGEKCDLFVRTNFGKFFTPPLMPFAWRKALALKWPIKLDRLASFFDSLNLKPVPNLLVNSVDAETNRQVVYCEEPPLWWPNLPDVDLVTHAFSTLGYGTVLTRSMVLPGLVGDEERYKDGGIAENPLMSVFPKESKILLMHLGYAGEVEKKGKKYPVEILDEALYAYEFKAASYAKHLMGHYPNLKAIYPKCYDVDSTAFSLSGKEKIAMIDRAYFATADQWSRF